MSLRIYIAAPFDKKAEAGAAQDQFEAAGFEVTSNWIKRESSLNYEDLWKPENDAELIQEAFSDVQDLTQSEIFVILNLGKSEGKATEMGIAYALGMPILLVGKRDTNIFYWLPEVFRTDSVETAIAGLIEINKQSVKDGETIPASEVEWISPKGEVLN